MTQGRLVGPCGLCPEHRLVLEVVPGARSIENAEAVVGAITDCTAGRTPALITSDEYATYETAIHRSFDEPMEPAPACGPGRRPILPQRRSPAGLTYATVHKERAQGHVVSVVTAVVLGMWAAVQAALERSRVRRTINTTLVERYHATDRGRNARKARRTYRFSKNWRMYEAMTYFTMYRYNYCWAVRTLR